MRQLLEPPPQELDTLLQLLNDRLQSFQSAVGRVVDEVSPRALIAFIVVPTVCSNYQYQLKHCLLRKNVKVVQVCLYISA